MDAAKTVIPDLDALWMPFTANRQYKAAPRLLDSASGMYYTSHDGRQILDGCAGLWCVAAGHCRQEIADAVARQVQTLDYAPPFQMSHPLTFEAATKVAAIMPAGLDRIFFTNSGSESVDTALKIALAYHRARGEGQRTRVIGRERGYHGVGFGGMAVGGIGPNRKAFSANLMPGTDHLPATLNIAEAAYSKGQPTWGAHLADDRPGDEVVADTHRAVLDENRRHWTASAVDLGLEDGTARAAHRVGFEVAHLGQKRHCRESADADDREQLAAGQLITLGPRQLHDRLIELVLFLSVQFVTVD